MRPDELRSRRWFRGDDLNAFRHRSRTMQMGYAPADFEDKPVIAIVSTWSDLLPCHSHFRSRVDDIKRGIWQAGGFPVETPALAVSETFMKPSAMLYRNLLAMEVEEILRSQPIDGAVLLGGCDKTTPGLLMGAASVDLPTIFVPGGPMLRSYWNGQTLGSGSDQFRLLEEKRAGNLSERAWGEIEAAIARSAGHCMTMGTASTMTAITEALGLTLPGASSIPAVDSGHARMASASGRRIVDMVWQDLRITTLLQPASFTNAIVTDMALGGSTNAILHLLALAGRVGVSIDLDTFDTISRRTPVLADLKPSGHYLMEDFHNAGGLRALLSQLTDLLALDCPNVSGSTLGDTLQEAVTVDEAVIRPRARALRDDGGTVVLRGNLAPDGCVLKTSAASPSLLRHRGRAVVFSDYADLEARIDDEQLDVDEGSVLVLQHAGPLGGPGMPEWGQLPIPKKLLRQGVRDMVRISDARMSGTSYGTCVLHVSPESFLGGPLALARNGDVIELDADDRRLHLDVHDDELARRRQEWLPPSQRYARGYLALYAAHVTQAHEGCDFSFLRGNQPTPEPEIHH
ncbi:MAG: dihydroxy-acid dehydratase [Trueperaceae bacterium]|nr:dihydroxy-acid dehydratase [Trueperaceae bacterium]